MDEIIQITTSNNILTVSGRELHEALKIETPYKKWFDRMCEYGFTENDDYSVMDIFVHNSNGGKQSRIDHQITLDMAKELCMIQRSEKGYRAEDYTVTISEGDVTDYWMNTAANALRPLYQLLAMAQFRPDGIWEGD